MSRAGEYRARAAAAAADEGWRERAQCRVEQVPTAWFYAEHTEQARAVCARCPVVEQCNLTAIHNREPAGVWGGKNREGRARRKAEADLSDDEICEAVLHLVQAINAERLKEVG